jgi:hypothetical protein
MLLFIDGMAHYATAHIDRKYTVVLDGVGTWAIAAEGRFANALKHTVTGGGFSSTSYVEVSPLMTQAGPWTPAATGVVGFAFKIDDLDLIRQAIGNHHVGALITIYEGEGPILSIHLNDTGTFSVYKHTANFSGDGVTYLGSSIQGIREGVWAYIEVKWNIAAAGNVTINCNEVEIFSYTGDTTASSYAHSYLDVWNTIRLLNIASTGAVLTMWMGDLYLADQEGAGDDIRDFLGDVTIDYIVPDGVGNIDDWTPLSGANWTNVEEVPPDDDTTYVSTTAIGTRDAYTMQNVPAGTVPLGFQTLLYARKETEGAASLKAVYREGGVNYDSDAQGITTVSEYRFLIQPYDTNPATSATITEAEINAAEFGVIKSS